MTSKTDTETTRWLILIANIASLTASVIRLRQHLINKKATD